MQNFGWRREKRYRLDTPQIDAVINQQIDIEGRNLLKMEFNSMFKIYQIARQFQINMKRILCGQK